RRKTVQRRLWLGSELLPEPLDPLRCSQSSVLRLHRKRSIPASAISPLLQRPHVLAIRDPAIPARCERKCFHADAPHNRLEHLYVAAPHRPRTADSVAARAHLPQTLAPFQCVECASLCCPARSHLLTTNQSRNVRRESQSVVLPAA